MSNHVVRLDPEAAEPDYSVLACALCGENYLHFDEVHIGGRPAEDGPFSNVIVDNTGAVRQHLSDAQLATPTMPMRRHYITLVGDCELCGGRFGYAFVQHKGQTQLQLLKPGWDTIDD